MAKDTARTYVVLKSVDDTPNWAELGQFDGDTDKQAIKAATNGQNPEERSGTFVAVPSRSFRPLPRAVETVEVDRWA